MSNWQYAGPVTRNINKLGRNAQCRCNSGKKFKNCCLPKATDARDGWVQTGLGYMRFDDPKLKELLESQKAEVVAK